MREPSPTFPLYVENREYIFSKLQLQSIITESNVITTIGHHYMQCSAHTQDLFILIIWFSRLMSDLLYKCIVDRGRAVGRFLLLSLKHYFNVKIFKKYNYHHLKVKKNRLPTTGINLEQYEVDYILAAHKSDT